jgi:Mg2+/Co2+ transporter CorB|tara:strand:- start:194 stop:565 length:372 start_codon:yes stop_codon:yes gene_type:complete
MKILLSLITISIFSLINYIALSHDNNNEAEMQHEDVVKATELSSGLKSENIIDVATNGMVCDFCAQAIEKVFMKREEVQGINVDLNNQRVVIYLKNDLSIEDTEIIKLFEESGYNVDKIDRTS